MKKINLLNFDVPSDAMICDLFMQDVIRATVTASDTSGLFSNLEQRPKNSLEISKELNINKDALDSVLRVLVASNYVIEKDSIFSLAPETKAYLVRSSPLYRGSQFKGVQGYDFWHDKILSTLKEGWSPIGASGESFTSMWEEGTLSEEAAKKFTGMMHTNISGPAIAVAKSGLFEDVEHLIDVGGGSGVFLTALRQLYPTKRLSLMELPQVCAAAKEIMNCYTDASTVGHYALNMFKDSWPRDGTAFFFSNVLHDWPKDKVYTILEKSYQALPTRGEIYIFECLLEEDRYNPLHTVVFDLLMYANHRSQQYSMNELSGLLSDSGFNHIEKVFEFGYYSLIKAIK